VEGGSRESCGRRHALGGLRTPGSQRAALCTQTYLRNDLPTLLRTAGLKVRGRGESAPGI